MKILEMPLSFPVLACVVFVFGSFIGSFLNVCIWRIPRGESVVWPPSHCPKCNARIRWYQNIPILSWIALRGRCANCRQPISIRYPVVELLGGALFFTAYLQWAAVNALRMAPPIGLQPFSDIWMVPVCWLVFAGLTLGFFVDVDHCYIPDRVTIGGVLLGIPASFAVPELQRAAGRVDALLWSLGGIVAGVLIFMAIAWLAVRALEKDVHDFGDLKLLGAVGAFFGPVSVLFVGMVASLLGAVAGIVFILRGGERPWNSPPPACGSFIALGTVVWMLWGPCIVNWCLSLHLVS